MTETERITGRQYPLGMQALAAGTAVSVMGDWYATFAAKRVDSEVGKMVVRTWVYLMFQNLALRIIMLGRWLTLLSALAASHGSHGSHGDGDNTRA